MQNLQFKLQRVLTVCHPHVYLYPLLGESTAANQVDLLEISAMVCQRLETRVVHAAVTTQNDLWY